MDKIIGITTAGKIAVGMVEDNRVIPPVSVYPEAGDGATENDILSMPMEEMVETVSGMIANLCQQRGAKPIGVGICFPGIIRDGVIEESPNLKQAT
jgi:glucokinase